MTPAPDKDAAAAVSRHKYVLLALVTCTAVMVTLSLFPLAMGLKIALILGIAASEAVVVAGVLMHLFSERRLIYSVLALTGILVVMLLSLPMLSQANHISHFFK